MLRQLSRLCITYFFFIVLLDVLGPLLSVQSSELLNYDGQKGGDSAQAVGLDGKASATLFPEFKDKESKDAPDATAIANNRKIDYNFLHAFFASISVIIVSELGDKTFFIAAIMAMRHSRVVVFLGAIAALGLMTVLSVFLGYATTVIPRKYTFYISTALFALFGLKMLKEGYDMDPNEGQEELEEVSAELKKKEAELQSMETTNDVETGVVRSQLRRSGITRIFTRLCSPIFLQAFTLTFLAEWGDRSQLTTIILGSRENPIGVSIGGTIGHALCTGLAVLGGRLVAQKISVRTVTVVGGVVFLIFAASALFMGDVCTADGYHPMWQITDHLLDVATQDKKKVEDRLVSQEELLLRESMYAPKNGGWGEVQVILLCQYENNDETPGALIDFMEEVTQI